MSAMRVGGSMSGAATTARRQLLVRTAFQPVEARPGIGDTALGHLDFADERGRVLGRALPVEPLLGVLERALGLLQSLPGLLHVERGDGHPLTVSLALGASTAQSAGPVIVCRTSGASAMTNREPRAVRSGTIAGQARPPPRPASLRYRPPFTPVPASPTST